MKQLICLFGLLFSVLAQAQTSTYPTNGVQDIRAVHYAFTNATVHVDYQKTIENATLIIKEGKVVSVKAGETAPKGAVVINCEGKTIYPAFIELSAGYGLPDVPKGGRKWTDPPQFVSGKKGAYGWNEAIHPEINAHQNFSVNGEKAKEWRKFGFGAVLSHQKDGIARGTGTLVNLSSKMDNKAILIDKASAHYSFKKGTSKQDYPSSLMGAIALLRQTHLDAKWYAKTGSKIEYNISLDSWNAQQNLPQVFLAGDKLSLLRADKIGDEFGKQYILQVKEDAYQRADAIKATNAPLILSVDYPKAFDVEDPYDALYVDLADLKHWELAPYGPKILSEKGINFAFTTDGLKDKKAFLKNIKTAIKKGLDKKTALKALTYNPANFINAYQKVGSLERGKEANFLICTADIFDKGEILQSWVAGEALVFTKKNETDLAGMYDLTFDNDRRAYKLKVSGEMAKPKAEIVLNDSTNIDTHLEIVGDQVSLYFSLKEKENAIRLSGTIKEETWSGRGIDRKGDWINWLVRNKRPLSEEEKEKAKKEADADKKDSKKSKDTEEESDEKETDEDEKEDDKPEEIGDICFPFLPYGWTEKPEQKAVLFKNATIWTNEADGILEEADVLIKDGKISKVGKNLAAGGATEIDASGKHITCGVIDEHSHIAISRGVNEGTQASSAEVSIADVINSEDINLYRQLAGGVTTSQLLHGSANPIGGQSGLIKFRWGSLPEEMKFKNADGFIKFALGENVKQSNWGDNNRSRFPQTRMGVEQVYIDHFTRAKTYAADRDPNKRIDLELETLQEIIEKKRFITCHSYQQGEITMLMRVAEQFGFNINTFTHILEGYKIADKMKAHGVAASTFSDWWTYKYEVIDAIPHNGAILNDMDVVTGFNSDDAEMARRLNSEAAKAVKYGGVSEEEAWKFVTLNPAKMLHIDNRVGSIKAGKDADIVLWNGHPMSVFTKAEQTYVDGRCYFDLAEDEKMREAIKVERQRLIQKMIAVKAGGGKTQKPTFKKDKLWHCDDMGEFGTQRNENNKLQGGHGH